MIHSHAVIDPSAKIDEDVSVGPFTVIGPDVEIGSGTVIGSHNVIKGHTRIGKKNKIFQFNTIGEDTPDLKYQGEQTWLHIGDGNTIREGVTIHRGTAQDQSQTVIGNDNLFMAYAHIGHDCVIGNNTILVNNGSLAGHVVLGDWAIVSGYSGVHQYANVGAHSFVGAYTWVTKDVPAFVTVAGNPARARAINSEGMKRRGFSTAEIRAIQNAYKAVYLSNSSIDSAKEKLRVLAEENPVVLVMLESIENAQRSIVR